MGRYHSKHSKKHKSHFKSYSKGCSYCGRNLEGLPHRCKYCGQVHCSDHILPEDHNCGGINKERKFGFRGSPKTYNRDSENNEFYNSSENNYVLSRRNKEFKYHRPSFRMPRIRLPRISKFFWALIFAIISYVLAINFIENSLFLWVEFFAWAYFSILLYKKPLRWANRVSMSDDLAFFGLRVLGFVVFMIGGYLIFAGLLASVLVTNSAPQSIPYFCLISGLVVLGIFIAFRTNRRHNVVGIWRA